MKVHDYMLVVLRTLKEDTDLSYRHYLEEQGVHVEVLGPDQDALAAMTATPPICACFHYDYPDMQGLADLRAAKQRVSSVPLLMVTQAHSERLAVWAFRSRVWDYFVQPVDTRRLTDVVLTLRDLRLPGHGRGGSPQALEISNRMPVEARVSYGSPNAQQAQLDLAITFIDNHLDRKIAQSEVAASCGLSVFQLSRLFKRYTGHTFQDFLLQRRLEEAKRLLANPGASITDVCFSVGFRDLSYFTRTFQRLVGLTPSAYRLSPAVDDGAPSSPGATDAAPDVHRNHTS